MFPGYCVGLSGLSGTCGVHGGNEEKESQPSHSRPKTNRIRWGESTVNTPQQTNITFCLSATSLHKRALAGENACSEVKIGLRQNKPRGQLNTAQTNMGLYHQAYVLTLTA